VISASDRALVVTVLLALAVSSVAYGAEVPKSFIGTYQGVLQRACMTSLIVLGKENIRWDRGGERKNVPYTVVEADEQHVVLELHSSDCRLPFLRLEGSKPDDANFVQEGLRVSGFRTRSEGLTDNDGLDCHYRRVDPELAEDQTARFLHSESAAEREKALDVINQQFHPESDKYNEIGLRDPSPAVRARAASFLRGDPGHVPLLIKAMAHDPDPKVRANAGDSLSSFYRGIDSAPEGDSGPDGDSDADDGSAGDNDSVADPRIILLEQNLDDLLIGLKTLTTLRFVVEILGGGDYDDSLVCHMSAKSREKTLNALNEQLEAIQVLEEESGQDWWSKAGQRVSRAMERKCNTVQSNRPPDSTSSPDDFQEDQAGSKGHRKKACEFAGLALPENYAIFAAGEYSGRKIDFQISQSGHQTTQMDVTVNYSSKPVVLILAAYEPTIWNIKWTAPTRIAAVFVSGYHRQAIAGLDPAVPVLNSSSENKGPCGSAIVVEEESALLRLNPMSRRLFGRPVDLVYLAKNGKAVVGDPVPAGEKLITSDSNPPESFYDKIAPRPGRAGLKDAVRKGLLRKATDADADAWVNAEIANAPKPDPQIAGQRRAMPRRPGIHNTYVVLKPFTFPPGLGSGTAAFFIPKGVPLPQGNRGPVSVLDFNKFKIEPPEPAPQTEESNAGNIHAASFDCSKATSEVEKIICANDELSRLDDSLMKAYQRVLDRTRKKEEMIESQNQWLENERNECQDAKCIRKAYEMRINELRLSSYSLVFFRPPVRSTPYSEVNTKLLKAAKKGSLEEVKTLLEKGADVNAKDQGDYLTVLMYAALSGNLELVKHLVNRGADVNARDKDDKTALMTAAAKGDLEAARFLLDSGADVHAEAANGNTALQLAEEEDNGEIVRLLKSHGAEE
jgi:uncharacterized protein YecT (DUF1311 family)